ncbi:MAG: biopolymer transporter ExbD [Bacteroidales bacterium]|nr:biopolymer transporter ExbD [Bacteroidales bacterium]
MSLRSRNKVSAEFSMSSMTDVVFLLLIFFMVTSTMIAPNALKLLLPSSNNQTQASPLASVSIKDNQNGTYTYAVGTRIMPFENLETELVKEMASKSEEAYVSLHVDKSVPMEEVVKIMNIAKKHEYKLILATQPGE